MLHPTARHCSTSNRSRSHCHSKATTYRSPRAFRRGVSCRVRNIDWPQALLFDCDGVLVDTEKDGHRVAFNQAFKDQGLNHEWSEEKYGELLKIGGGKERMTAYFTECATEEPFKSITDPKDQEQFIKDLHLTKTRLFQRMIQSGEMPLRPGVKELVGDAIDAGAKVAVCSTSNEEAVQTIVDVLLGTDISKVMRVFAGDVVAKKKPDPAIYELAATALGAEPARWLPIEHHSHLACLQHLCVVIEDSNIGVRAARAAGMRCVVTVSSYTKDEDFALADAVFDKIEDNFTVDDLTTPGNLWLNPPLPMDENGNWINPPQSPYGEKWVDVDVAR